jgi:hypothetical protein
MDGWGTVRPSLSFAIPLVSRPVNVLFLDEGIRMSFRTSNTQVNRELEMSFVGTAYLFTPIFDVSTALQGLRGLYRYGAMSKNIDVFNLGCDL